MRWAYTRAPYAYAEPIDEFVRSDLRRVPRITVATRTDLRARVVRRFGCSAHRSRSHRALSFPDIAPEGSLATFRRRKKPRSARPSGAFFFASAMLFDNSDLCKRRGGSRPSARLRASRAAALRPYRSGHGRDHATPRPLIRNSRRNGG